MEIMVEVVVKTCLNLTKNIYLKFDAGRRYKIDERQFSKEIDKALEEADKVIEDDNADI